MKNQLFPSLISLVLFSFLAVSVAYLSYSLGAQQARTGRRLPVLVVKPSPIASQLAGVTASPVFNPTIAATPISSGSNGQSAPTNPLAKVQNYPRLFEIPTLKVSATIESVGLDANKQMDVPRNVNNVAWYNLGAKPGDPGNVVIAGHLDSVKGPAILYHLKELKKGDPLIITQANGQRLTYTVSQSEDFDYTNFPLNDIFGASNHYQLRIITCGGTYDKKSRNYTKRTVVTAVLEGKQNAFSQMKMISLVPKGVFDGQEIY